MTGPTWLFGYGSLIWRPDFPFLQARDAHVVGWTRRFWQGSHDHRGIGSDPGRVVTLIEAPGECCHGRAYLIDPDVFEHLDRREINGYQRHRVEVIFDPERAPGVMYVARVDNAAFLGEASPEEMVAQIRRCAGLSGSNLEYVLELARALRALEVSDPHVFELEALLHAAPMDATSGG